MTMARPAFSLGDMESASPDAEIEETNLGSQGEKREQGAKSLGSHREIAEIKEIRFGTILLDLLISL